MIIAWINHGLLDNWDEKRDLPSFAQTLIFRKQYVERGLKYNASTTNLLRILWLNYATKYTILNDPIDNKKP